jgi:hypothetical protein
MLLIQISYHGDGSSFVDGKEIAYKNIKQPLNVSL